MPARIWSTHALTPLCPPVGRVYYLSRCLNEAKKYGGGNNAVGAVGRSNSRHTLKYAEVLPDPHSMPMLSMLDPLLVFYTFHRLFMPAVDRQSTCVTTATSLLFKYL
jgi:hypothetical protein